MDAKKLYFYTKQILNEQYQAIECIRAEINMDAAQSKKITALAKALDASVPPHNLSAGEIDALIQEAKKYGKKKKNC